MSTLWFLMLFCIFSPHWLHLIFGNKDLDIVKQASCTYAFQHAKNTKWRWKELNLSLLTVLSVIGFIYSMRIQVSMVGLAWTHTGCTCYCSHYAPLQSANVVFSQKLFCTCDRNSSGSQKSLQLWVFNTIIYRRITF